LDKIEAFAGDAVIDVSVWGEPGLHPEFESLAGMDLDRPALSLVLETSGLGWKAGTVERIAEKAAGAARRLNGMLPVSWIVSLNERDLPPAPAAAASAVSAACENSPASFVLRLSGLFPKAVYVQAVRTKGAEDNIERFYRAWKSAAGPEIIIQKYNDFCKALPERNAVDLSPVRRRPCWHVMRDFIVLINGGVPCCVNACPSIWNGEAGLLLGNAFTESLETVWEKGTARYLEHCKERYGGICTGCDEYYTYNF
jgi:spiro-SPASM protein